MNGKTVLITGATDGIGKQTALELALSGYNIIIHGRNETRVKKTVDEIKSNLRQTKADVSVNGYVCDLSSQKNIRSFAREIKNSYDRLDVLINNAGVYMKQRELNEDGFEMTFAVNHLAHFLLSNLLLDLIKKSDNARIINVSSIAHQNARLEWDNFNGEKYYEPYSAYALSKLANILFTKELAKKLKNSSVTTNSLHPGVISTKLLKSGFNISGDSVINGARTSIFLASSDKIKSISGEYFIDCKVAQSHPLTYDQNICEQFWDDSLNKYPINY